MSLSSDNVLSSCWEPPTPSLPPPPSFYFLPSFLLVIASAVDHVLFNSLHRRLKHFFFSSIFIPSLYLLTPVDEAKCVLNLLSVTPGGLDCKFWSLIPTSKENKVANVVKFPFSWVIESVNWVVNSALFWSTASEVISLISNANMQIGRVSCCQHFCHKLPSWSAVCSAQAWFSSDLPPKIYFFNHAGTQKVYRHCLC